ncbi:VWA domain-containing protein [Acidomonas methanolica]|uniref:VWA domain-containing protein n=3 Tax=Acidomonas methanolica TaxID=437 RepID=UPI00104EEC31|nr:VWA domain-containing protein [Acidomonas methanolica]MBU2653959.1 VWA domain-containing protein [Acidomonas methanolica]TCS30920.1 hypothetical protein EDC31_104115 [Acidomonas methanolica]GEK98283.1 hypothetical protein AME01nite_07820 [Acidomonas methanolica NBRC 104435]
MTSGLALSFPTLGFAPLLPLWALGGIALLATALSVYGALRRAPGLLWRLGAILVLLLWLGGPRLLHPVFRPEPQDALLVVDHSPSMDLRGRASLADAIAARLKAEAARIPGLTLHVVTAQGGKGQGTRLFDAMDQADLPQGRFAGAILVTDGMDHDVPAALPPRFRAADGSTLPLHVLLTGKGEETDRRLTILQAPPFAIVGQTATVRVRIDDLGTSGSHSASLTIREGNAPPRTVTVRTGVPQDIAVPITRPGPMLVGLSVSPLTGEVSELNNRDVVRINGVRDRLKVLLVSGTPNQGERVWRSLLKSDPSVDLVHFTILRPPDKDDGTPLSDLALIPFPIKELFQDRIRQFDLIILDGFRNTGIVPLEYLENIADYVKGGGGLLLTAGPEFAEEGSLENTPLEAVLPAHVPQGGVEVARFTADLTALGRRHPVTAGLPGAPQGSTPPGWGPWYRALRSDTHQGEVLMSGPQEMPLLVLNRVQKGRVALILSDQMWLWSRGEGGGGPQAELLRRLAHWLMKEPELEENQLQADIENGTLTVTRRSAGAETPPAAIVTSPDGTHQPLALTRRGDGLYTGVLRADGSSGLSPGIWPYGIWTVRDGDLTAFAAPQASDPVERQDLRATAERLGPVARASGSAPLWIGAAADAPALRQVAAGDAVRGSGWIGLPRRMARAAAELRPTALLPAWAAMAAALALLFIGWRREGRR